MKDFADSGFKILEYEDYYKRLCVCSTCPFKSKDWKCNDCGCYLLVKAKLATSGCPQGKWPILSNESSCNC